jgi:hypothetical protein
MKVKILPILKTRKYYIHSMLCLIDSTVEVIKLCGNSYLTRSNHINKDGWKISKEDFEEVR